MAAIYSGHFIICRFDIVLLSLNATSILAVHIVLISRRLNALSILQRNRY